MKKKLTRTLMKRIPINEEYALSADPMNILLLVQTKDKDDKFTGNYRTLGYYSNVEGAIRGIQRNVMLSTIPEVNTLESLVNSLQTYMLNLQDNLNKVVEELRK